MLLARTLLAFGVLAAAAAGLRKPLANHTVSRPPAGHAIKKTPAHRPLKRPLAQPAPERPPAGRALKSGTAKHAFKREPDSQSLKRSWAKHFWELSPTNKANRSRVPPAERGHAVEVPPADVVLRSSLAKSAFRRPSAVRGDCYRKRVHVVLFTHKMNARIRAVMRRWDQEALEDCSLKVWLAWAGPEADLEETPDHVGHYVVSPQQAQEVLGINVSNCTLNQCWELYRHPVVPMLWRHHADDTVGGNRLTRPTDVWVFENDAEIMGSLSSFVHAYDHSEHAFIASMLICGTHNCTADVGPESVVIHEGSWRRNNCVNVDRRAFGGMGGFVMVARFSTRLLEIAEASAKEGSLCYVEKFFATLCMTWGLPVRSLFYRHIGMLDIVFPHMVTDFMASLWDSYTGEPKVVHPIRLGNDYRLVKHKPLSEWKILPGRRHELCRRAAATRYANQEFNAPKVECLSGCWQANTSDPSSVCTDVVLPGAALAMTSMGSHEHAMDIGLNRLVAPTLF